MLQLEQIEFLKENLPFYPSLSASQSEYLFTHMWARKAAPGEMVHAGEEECLGVVLVQRGRLRAFMNSPEGRELTLYFVGAGSLSMLAASCILENAALPVYLSAQEETCLFIIPPGTYNTLRAQCPAVEHYTSEVLGSSFAQTMRAIESTVFLTVEQRLALLLLQQAAFEQSTTLHLTQEGMARHLGTAREVITRLLKGFAEQGLVQVFRGGVTILRKAELTQLVPDM
ncbi:Crp/Fnr family transcriptional regulator [Ruminococcaceae bacterium OttesenSCG-928-N02]|nr:Crp/Fnr family transcriptional regulator [Ruminococcaceae bacterium OttesenSCG-928-N02]